MHSAQLLMIVYTRTQLSNNVQQTAKINPYLKICLFMYTASVIFDYYCRDRELSYIGGIGFQSTPPLEGAGVFNVPEGDSPQNTEPPFIA